MAEEEKSSVVRWILGCGLLGFLAWLAFLAVTFLPALSGRESRGPEPDRPTVTERLAASTAAEMERVGLAYLEGLAGVAWVEVDGNDAYIGFHSVPSDLRTVVNGAAFQGNRATGFGFHAWAVDARRSSPGWRPGQAGFVCSATARHGRVESSDCR